MRLPKTSKTAPFLFLKFILDWFFSNRHSAPGFDNFQKSENICTPHMQGEPYINLDENTICISYLELKHGFSKVCDRLIFHFVSKDTERSFKINYRLSANELPDAVKGNLHIRIGDDSNE